MSKSQGAAALLAVLFVAIGTSPAFGVDCGTDCWASRRLCTDVPFTDKMVCTSPEPTCYSNCLIVKGARCGLEATRRNEPFHGVYCGYGNKDQTYKTPGIDALDEACK